MATRQGCRNLMIGWGIDEYNCFEVVSCPVCGLNHAIMTDVIDFDDLAFPYLPVTVATAKGKGDIEKLLSLVCPVCHSVAETVCGAAVLEDLCREGEIEEYEAIVMEINQLLTGAMLHLNG